jgi:hypothetical protein
MGNRSTDWSGGLLEITWAMNTQKHSTIGSAVAKLLFRKRVLYRTCRGLRRYGISLRIVVDRLVIVVLTLTCRALINCMYNLYCTVYILSSIISFGLYIEGSSRKGEVAADISSAPRQPGGARWGTAKHFFGTAQTKLVGWGNKWASSYVEFLWKSCSLLDATLCWGRLALRSCPVLWPREPQERRTIIGQEARHSLGDSASPPYGLTARASLTICQSNRRRPSRVMILTVTFLFVILHNTTRVLYPHLIPTM